MSRIGRLDIPRFDEIVSFVRRQMAKTVSMGNIGLGSVKDGCQR